MASKPKARRKPPVKKSNTRAGRASAKTKSPSNKAVIKAAPPAPVALSSGWRLSIKAAQFLWLHRRLLSGVTAIYGLMNLLFLGSLIDVNAVRDEFGNRVVGGLVAYTQLIGGSTSVTTGSRFIIFLMACLAVVWSLRQAYAGLEVRIRDAYYKGMAPLVPFVLVFVTALLKLLPAAVGVNVYQALVINQILLGTPERIIGGVITLALVVLSFYLVISSVFALFIVTLPNLGPWEALRLARRLVSKRRFTIVRKLLFLPLFLLLLTVALLLPFILYAAVAVPVILLFIVPILGTATITYIYLLYRELAND